MSSDFRSLLPGPNASGGQPASELMRVTASEDSFVAWTIRMPPLCPAGDRWDGRVSPLNFATERELCLGGLK